MMEPTITIAPTRHLVRWVLIGWCALALIVAGWLGGNLGAGVYWEDIRLPVVAEYQTWTAKGVSLTFNRAMVGTTVTKPGRNPVEAIPDAVFLVVAFDFQWDPSVDNSCSIKLVGDRRSWSMYQTLDVLLTDLVPGANSNCTTSDGSTNGVYGALFQIPQSALSEIKGVKITVGSSDWQVATLFAEPSESALLRIGVS